MLSTKVNNSIISPELSCDCSHATKQYATLNEHDYKLINSSQIANHENQEDCVNNLIDNNNIPFSCSKVLDNSRNNDIYYSKNNLTDNNPTQVNPYKTNIYNHENCSSNQLTHNYPDSLNYNYEGSLKEKEDSTKNNIHESYQLHGKNANNDFLSHKYSNIISYEQGNDDSYEERTKYNRRKSTFNDNFIKNSNYHNQQYSYNDNGNINNTDNKNFGITGNITTNRRPYNTDDYNFNNNDINKNNNLNNSSNNNDVFYENNNDSYQYVKDIQNGYEKNFCNLNNENQYDMSRKILEEDNPYEKNVGVGFKKNNRNYDKETNNLNTFTIDELYGNANINRERNMNHTKIFDYVESDDDKKNRQKNVINTFVPKYKNLSAKEVHYNSLSGNDNITVLAANKIKMDLNRSSEKSKDVLPNVYPFNLSSDFKNDRKYENKEHLEKLYPTNYNYINNYNKNNCDISLEQRRYNMNSSHIFDCENDTKKENFEKFRKEKKVSCKNMEDKDKVDMEKEEKRKLNPMYSDLFGRKTPDIDINANYEKIMPTTMKTNWMHDARNAKKYSEFHYKSSDNLEYNGTEKFHRKSYFDKDGYDNKKRLQDAIQKGSKISLQAHLQSTLQNENNYNYNPSDYNNVEAFYLYLHNISDSISDDEIKKVIKSSNAHIVSYESEYDLLSNKRKNNAKLCIRHNKGKHGLNLLINSLSQLNIKATVL